MNITKWIYAQHMYNCSCFCISKTATCMGFWKNTKILPEAFIFIDQRSSYHSVGEHLILTAVNIAYLYVHFSNRILKFKRG